MRKQDYIAQNEKSEEQYRKLVEFMPDAIIVHNGTVQFANNAAVKLFKARSKKDLIGKDFVELIHNDHKKNAQRIIENIIKNGEKASRVEGKFLTIDGQSFYAEVTAVSIELDNIKLIQVVVRDITARKKSEKAHRDAHERYITLINNVPGMVYSCLNDENWTMTYVSNEVLPLTGYSKNDLLNNKTIAFNDLIHPDDRQYVWDTIQKKLKEKKPYNLGYRIYSKDKTLKWVWERGQGIFDENGNLQFLEGLIIDTSELKDTQEKLSVLSAVIEQTKEGVAIASTEGNISYVNKAWCEMHGYEDASEIIGKNVSISHNEEQMEKEVLPAFDKTIEQGTFHGEMNHITKDGTPFPTLISTMLLKDSNGKPFTTAAIVRDITKLKKVEKALLESEERYKNFFEKDITGDVLSTADGQIIECNTAFVKILGYGSKEELKKHKIVEFYQCQDDRKIVLNNLAKKKELINYEVNYKRKDGRIINCIQNAVGIFNKEGKLVNIQTYINDITLRKIAEEQLKQQNEEYEALNEELTQMNEELRQTNEELVIAKKKAEESDRLKSSFLANVSHEIRTPMNGILGFADLLKSSKISDVEKQEYLEIIEKSGERMLDTINDIIDISKIEAGQIKPFIKEISLNDQLEDIYRFFKPEADHKKIDLLLTKFFNEGHDIILTDKKMLDGILTNLLKNAIKFTSKGQIEFGYELKENAIQFFVKDTGIGIDKDVQETIFNRFTQEEQGHTRQYEGAGLGLAISKAYVDMLEGKIWLESEKNKGTTFNFSIPYQAPAQPVQNINDPKKEKKILKKKINILIAEDEDYSYTYLSIALKDYYKNIYRAKNGNEAILFVRDNPQTDLVLMDIKMPELNGFEATGKIREFNKDIIIVAQTAYAFSDDRDKALEAGCNDYISKPMKGDTLLTIINQYFSE